MKNKKDTPPIVLHIPHSSLRIPPFIRETLLCDDAALEENLRAYTDINTDTLFKHKDLPRRVVFPVSRMVCDPERFRSDADEPMSQVGSGAVYVQDAFLRPLRHPTPLERELLLRLYYDPHHARLEREVASCLHSHGRCLIVDCHSFSPTPLPYEPDQTPARPDVCIGAAQPFTPQSLEDLAVDCFRSQGYTVEVNRPYSGTMMPRRYLNHANVYSVMIEVNRATYCERDGNIRRDGYERMKKTIDSFLKELWLWIPPA